MIADSLLLFSGSINPVSGALTGQAVTATAVSTNSIDAAPAALNQLTDIGRGENTQITVHVAQTVTAAGAATVNFELIQADDFALTTNVETLGQTGAIPKATLVAGARIALQWPRAMPYAPRRYIGVRYTVGTGPLTAGAFATFVGKDFHDSPAPLGKVGFTIS
jgi:hypothetical protein